MSELCYGFKQSIADEPKSDSITSKSTMNNLVKNVFKNQTELENLLRMLFTLNDNEEIKSLNKLDSLTDIH